MATTKYICESCRNRRKNGHIPDYSMEKLDEDKDGQFGGVNCEESSGWKEGGCRQNAEYKISTENPNSPPGY